MCGRFNLRSSTSAIVQQFLPGADVEALPVLKPRMNIAPSQDIACILRPKVGGPRQLSLFRWGLVPSWADDPAIGNRMINARCETAPEKPSFRAAMRSHRCIIPADGYYEWKKTADGKQPYEYSRRDGRLLALAGLWECNTRVAKGDDALYTCTILTTSANEFAAEDHDRMPVILTEDCLDRWLDPAMRDMEAIRAMMQPAAEELLQKRAVSKELNKVVSADCGGRDRKT